MNEKNQTDFLSMTLPELCEWVLSVGEDKYRAAQIYRWLHINGAASTGDMKNIPKSLREKIDKAGVIKSPKIEALEISKCDGSRKYLFSLFDGETIESVLMRYKHGNSVCISSQAGCAMGCVFCASAIDGKVRSLSAGEMLGEIYQIKREIKERISNLVVMGSGEPLCNYENTVRFIKMVSDENGQNISQRNITVSTCGIVPGIRALAEEGLKITLALSLHSADPALRRRLMPMASHYDLNEVIGACEYYFLKTGRRVTYEYIMIEGVNDSDEDAIKISALIGEESHINLIAANPAKGKEFRPPSRGRIAEFKKKLEKNKINVTIRRELGRDIEGACGQLKRGYKRHS